jgi:hypothetical protein
VDGEDLTCGLDALHGERWQSLPGMIATPVRARRFEML